MKKALRVISIAMPFVVFILFFVPLLQQSVEDWVVDLLGHGGSNFSMKNFAMSSIAVEQGCVIAFFIVSLALSALFAMLCRKRIECCAFNIFAVSYFWIAAIAFKQEYKGIINYTFHAAFYISLILSAFFLAVFIAYAVKWLKSRLDSRPPREHKPTKAERIAELEARVRELENREPQNRD